ncbi:hypothetical protein EPN16_07490 [bacterium]|nr:MAG: hypothetical protein EPN16_07490 [bacterium]
MSCKKPKLPNERDVLRVKEKYENHLLSLANVVGVGIGYKTIQNVITNRLCIKVYVENKIPLVRLAKAQRIPGKFNNVETDVEETGKLKA